MTVNVSAFDLFGQILDEDFSIVGVDLNFHVERSFKNDTERWVLGQLQTQQECSTTATLAQCRTLTRTTTTDPTPMSPYNLNRTLLYLAVLVMLRGLAQESPPASGLTSQVLWYEQPAAKWVEALPVGNGRVGAMVFGGVQQERLQLNEATLWAGGPYNPVNPEAKAALPQVRQLINEGRYRDAAKLTLDNFVP